MIVAARRQKEVPMKKADNKQTEQNKRTDILRIKKHPVRDAFFVLYFLNVM